MHRRSYRLLLLVPLIFLTGASCRVITARPHDTGVVRSNDGGTAWTQQVGVGTGGESGTLSSTSITRLAVDRATAGRLFAATTSQGLYRSDNRADFWQPTGIVSGTVSDVALHPTDGNTVYATLGTEVVKSTDGGVHFSPTYTDPDTGATLTTVDVDWFNPDVVLAGNSKGALVKSANAGTTWSPLSRFNAGLTDLTIDPSDSRRIFAVTASGLFRSTDQGAHWEELSGAFASFPGANRMNDFSLSMIDSATVYVATAYGLLVSRDAGSSWQPVETLVAFGTIPIDEVAIDPGDPNRIFIAADRSVHGTTDGGVTWKPLLTLGEKRTLSAIEIDPGLTAYVYLGVVAH